jgi:4-diphosphocytidyl-2-C-methyl-D-erythritol kinase
MKSIDIFAKAKINLYLDVLSKRDDGYHELSTIMQHVSLSDKLTLRETNQGIMLTTDTDKIPTDCSNIAFKAAQKIIDYTQVNKGVHIHIEKHIPTEAGLAGGSSDAAAVINGLNQLWNLNLSLEERLDIGKTIGADVPFCIYGKPALCEGVGEKISPVTGLEEVDVIIVKPKFSISTKKAFQEIDSVKTILFSDRKKIIELLNNKQYHLLSQYTRNSFEEVVSKWYPVITEIISLMKSTGALDAHLTGSGSAVFGIYEKSSDVDKVTKILDDENIKYYICRV